MKKAHLLRLALGLALGLLSIPAGARADDAAPAAAAPDKAAPTPYPDPHNESAWPGRGVIRCFPWMTDNRNFFWTQRAATQGAVVIGGDSLMGNWGYDYGSLKTKYFPSFTNLKFVNRGVGGDVSRGLLFRFQEDLLDLHPRAVVILIGSNDLSAKENTDDAISNINAMIDLAQKQDPAMPVIVCTVPPRNSPEAPIDHNELVGLNDKIRKLADGKSQVHILDLYPLFVSADGVQPDPQYFRKDLLHFGPDGYTKLGQEVGKLLTSLNIQ